VVNKWYHMFWPGMVSVKISNPAIPFSILVCSRFSRVRHVHVAPYDSTGGLDRDRAQVLTHEQFMSKFAEILGSRSWLEAMNHIDKARSVEHGKNT